MVLHTLYAFDIPALVPLGAGTSITYGSLAASCGSDDEGQPLRADDLRRVLQAAISFRIFEEASPNVSVRHNAVSAVFAGVPGMRDFLGLLAEEHAPAAGCFVESLRRWPGSGEPGHAALMVAARREQQINSEEDEALDPSKGLFDYISHDAARVARFRSAMGVAALSPAFSPTHFVERLPWSSDAAPETVVDIGGAGGELSQLILRTHARVRRAVSLDLPEVVAGAQVPADLEGRLEFAAYDFLAQTVPREGADAYVFRHIFHDWSDQYAARILSNLVPALKPGRSRVWLSEVVLPDLGCYTRDQLQRSADLHMKAGFNGKERSRQDWESLFAQVDKRFRIVNITQPDGAHDAVIEVAFDA
ncbi:S-adenosyl-L-methionine-dependent methyltransferase [Camillea tinctor]|nr:S-adenosyl-L-methionine-dependent methyltransferase [Camillea tinctor]